MTRCLEYCLMALMTDRVKARRNLYGLTSETKNIAFEVNDILDMKSTHSDGYVDRIG